MRELNERVRGLYFIVLFLCCHDIAGHMVKKCVHGVCEALIDAEEMLNELDSGSGDGDCGSTVKAGALGKGIP